ncbi:protein of unknown function [Alkalispirochaeta americana]|uniref:eCIS core domain-containing protein n=1 Tax=Alkalispirochaeta americana TaxID=159291 RepID=A0A1N6X043_9SPIO|nr:DUF4157 domain-containing protein [Alkalispirochaeta americana]SIQ95687.1 protein of unknown function [Alkalispirochaeta americana]
MQQRRRTRDAVMQHAIRTWKLVCKHSDAPDEDPHGRMSWFGATDRTFPLEAGLKDQLEHLFGVDLSNVRIHIGEHAEELTRQAGAVAVTIGNDIYFARGMYAPHSDEGRQLLVHELQHVVQVLRGERMVYSEELLDLELEAELVSTLLQGRPLEAIERDKLQGDTPGAFGHTDEATPEGLSRGTGGGELAQFSAANNGVVIELCLRSGEVVRLSKREYERVIEASRKQFEEELAERLAAMTREAGEREMMKVYAWSHRGLV